MFCGHPYLGKISNLTSIFFRWVVQPPTRKVSCFSFVCVPGSTTELPDVDVKSLGSLDFFVVTNEWDLGSENVRHQKNPPKLQALQNHGEKFLSKQKKHPSRVGEIVPSFFLGILFQSVSSWTNSVIQISLSIVTSFEAKTHSDLGGIFDAKPGFGQKKEGPYFKVLLKITCQSFSHYFHIIGDGHQPNSRGLYTHYKDPY